MRRHARMARAVNGRPRVGFWLAGVLLGSIGGSMAPHAAEPPVVLRDVTAESGITFRHTDGGSGRRYIVETVSAGLALLDFDGDGRTDIYFLNGAPLPGAPRSPVPRNALYRNEGGWRFTDVTEWAGVGDPGYGLGVTVGDYDGDGRPDLYLNNFGPNVLYRNEGDGRFRDVTEEAGVGNGSRVGAGTCFLDMDGDGDLDLYVANYLRFTFDSHVETTTAGFPVYANPRFYRPDPDTLYRNNGDGTFTDVSEASGIAAHAGWGMGITCGDYDADGDTDVFIGNDVAENYLFQNDGSGRFEEVGLLSGAAFDFHGDEQGSMGVDCGDYDGDGRLDFYVTSYQRQLATLYRNVGDGLFEDVTLTTGAGRETLRHVTWGVVIADMENDGDSDILVARGHLHDNVESWDDSTRYRVRNLLLLGDGHGRFLPQVEDPGGGLGVEESTRGLAVDDLDGDGDLDVVALNSRAPPTLLRNETRSDHHWLRVRLRGARKNRDGVGARVTVVTQARSFVDEVHSGRGYQGHFGTTLHFGLGSVRRVDRIEVRWVGGSTETYHRPEVDRTLELAEGEGHSVR